MVLIRVLVVCSFGFVCVRCVVACFDRVGCCFFCLLCSMLPAGVGLDSRFGCLFVWF